MDQSEVRINTIHSAVGAINETDVVLADASNAIIIGFGVRPDGKARSAAEREGVEIRCYDVIYKCSRTSTLLASVCSSPPRSRSPRVLRPFWTPSRCPRSASPPVSASKRRDRRDRFCAPGARRHRGLQR